MKKYIMPFLAALLALTSCYDLDRAPYDQLSSSTFWQTEDQCKSGLMGVYASLKNTDLYGKMFMIDVTRIQRSPTQYIAVLPKLRCQV